ncbi:hypothetical protein NL676_026776 [Syzygium grande]|nr:hypothetical protein NL676_026776 [Syzygium grande]
MGGWLACFLKPKVIQSRDVPPKQVENWGQRFWWNPEFVNHGLLLWHQTRQQWIGNKKDEIRPKQVLEPRLSWNATYDSLLGSNKRFAQRVPLAEMVDFLVDIWEQEGMYD